VCTSRTVTSTEPESDDEEEHKESEARQIARGERRQQAQPINDGHRRNGEGRKEKESHRAVEHRKVRVARRRVVDVFQVLLLTFSCTTIFVY
jgi:hypothetical protein